MSPSKIEGNTPFQRFWSSRGASARRQSNDKRQISGFFAGLQLATFVRQRLSEALSMATYFCDAYASWQKGGVENANGRLRRWLPRRMNLDDVSDKDMAEIVMTYNLTPRKCLGYRTPLQSLLSELGRDVRLRFA